MFVTSLRRSTCAVSRVLVSAVLLLICSTNAFAASGCRSTASGLWTSGSTWTGCHGTGGVPSTTDDVSINGSTTVTLTSAATVASLTYAPSVSSTAWLKVEGGGALTVSGTLTINGANGGSGKVALLTINTGGSVTVNGASGVAAGVSAKSKLTFTGTGTLTTTILSAGLTYTPFNGSTIGLTGTGTVPVYAYRNLTINGSGKTMTLAGAMTVAEVLTIQAGTLDTSASNFQLTITGSLADSGGTLNARASTINANGNVSGAGAISFTGAGTLNVGGDNTSTGTFTAATSTVNYNKAGTQTARGGITYYNLTMSGNGAKDLATATTVSNTFTLSGTASSTAGAALTLKDVSIGAGTTLDLGSSSHTISGNVTDNGTLSASSASATFSGTTQSITGSATTISVNNVTINATSTLTPGGSITTLNTPGTLTINGTLSPSTAQTISGGALTGSGTAKTPSLNGFLNQYTHTTRTLTNLTVDYNGTSSQTINAASYGKLKISGSLGGTLDGDASVSGILTLAGGNITTGSNSLTLGGSGSVTRTTGFIIGNFVKTFNSPSSLSFEVGTSSGYSPVTVNATAGAFPATFLVKATQGSHPNVPGPDGLRRYWTTSSTLITTADLTFNYLDPTDIAGTEANYSLGRWTGTAWVYPASTLDTVNNRVTTNNATAFGDYELHARATKLIITSVNGGSSVEAGTPFSIVVKSLDADNNPTNVKDDTGVSIDVFSGTQASLGGTTTGIITANTNTLTISGLTYSTEETVVLRASSTSGDTLTAGNSPSFNVVKFLADHIVITSSAGDLPSATSRSITAEIRDSNGFVKTTDNTTIITFAQTAGTGSLTGLGSQQVTAGVASVTVTGVGAGLVTITASAPSISFSGTSTFQVVAGAAHHITFTSSTANLTSGASRSLTVELRDVNQNVLTSDSSTGVSFAQTAGAGSVSGLSSSTFSGGTASTNATGVVAGSVTVTASSNGVTSGTTTFSVVVGSADHLTFTSSNADLQSGATRALVAEIHDVNENVRTADTTLVTFAQTGGTGSVSGTSSVNAVNGIATLNVTGLNLGSVTITASAPGVPNNGTSSFNVIVGAAHHFTFTSSTADLESTTSRPLTAEIRDVNQHVLTDDSATSVTFAQISGSGSVDGLTSTTAINGIASLTITGFTAGSVTITAHATGVPNDGTTTFNVVASLADHFSFTSSTADLDFNATRQLRAEIHDPNDNVVITDSSSSVTFAKTAGTGTVTGLGASTASAGVATITITGGSTPGSITITASATTVPVDGDTTFNIVNSPPPVSSTPPYLVKNINASGDSSPSFITAMTDGRVVFRATEPVAGSEPWISNGTLSGTSLLSNIEPSTASSSPSNFATVNGLTFFVATTSANGTELWKTDGTTTSLVKDINASGSSNPSSLTGSNNTLFFAANNGTLGVELWSSNGQLAGTAIVQDSNPTGSSSPAELADANGTLFFSADDGNFGRELWKSDGSSGGTTMVANIASGSASSSPRNLSYANGKLYFTADGTSTDELWTSNGTGGGTFRVFDINPSGGDSVSVVLPVGSTNLFAANDGTNGRELWKTDGTTAQLVLDINPGSGSGVPVFTKSNAVVAGGILYFAADDGVHGVELWKSDGTAGGTAMVKDICPNDCSSNPTSLVASGGTIYFRATNPYVGDELWVSDGTAAGTKVTSDLEPGIVGAAPDYVTAASNLVYFSATTTAAGKELYAVCTTATTHLSVTGPSTATVGSSISVSVSPLDASNVLVPCYTGIVHFSTTGSATLPANYTFVAGEGAHSFNVTPTAAGSQTVTVQDTVTGTIVGTITFVAKIATTTTITTNSPNPSFPGQSVQLIATISQSPATGTVTFKDGATTLNTAPVSGGTATLNTTALTTIGNHTITALYSGDGTYESSTSAGVTQTVSLAQPVISSAQATSTSSISISWNAISGASGYDVYRSDHNSAYALVGQPSGTSFTDNSITLQPDTTYLYKVAARDSAFNDGPQSALDPATTIIFTDDPVTTSTKIKAVHITQLRTAVNAMLVAAGQPTVTFTDSSLTGVKVKKVHIQELRTGLTLAHSTLGLSAISYTDTTITVASTKVKAAHINELRNGVK